MTENETERCTKERGDIRKHLLCKYKIILNTYLSIKSIIDLTNDSEAESPMIFIGLISLESKSFNCALS